MTRETTTQLSPAEVIAESKLFFTRLLVGYAGTIEDETDSSVVLSDFRNRIAISAWTSDGTTRVRVSTQRPDERLSKYLMFIRTAAPNSAAPTTGTASHADV